MRAILVTECVEPIIDQYLKVLLRKQNYLVTKDDYGDYQFDDWFKEIDSFYKNKVEEQLKEFQMTNLQTLSFLLDPKDDKSVYLGAEDVESLAIRIRFLIDNLLDEKKALLEENDEEYSENMDGIQYEEYIKSRFLKLGCNAYVTKASGDQGVDVVVETNGTRVAVQCKHYLSSKVGNDAVQQVYSAKNFFDCDIAAVISNTDFSKQAKQLSEKLSVHLLHHGDIDDFVENLASEIGY